MRHTRRFVFSIVFALLSLPVLWAGVAQSYQQNWRWQRFGKNDGIPIGSIRQFFETSDGTLWVSSGNTIAWFNHYEWKNIILPSSASELTTGFSPAVFYENKSKQLFVMYGNQLFVIQNKQARRVFFTRSNTVIQAKNFALMPDGLPLVLSYSEKQNSYQLIQKRLNGYEIIWEDVVLNDFATIDIFSLKNKKIIFQLNNAFYFIQDGFDEKKPWIELTGNTKTLAIQSDLNNGLFLSVLESGIPALYHIDAHGNKEKIDVPDDRSGIVSISFDKNGSGVFLSRSGKAYLYSNNQLNAWDLFLGNSGFYTSGFSSNGDLWLGGYNEVYRFRNELDIWKDITLKNNQTPASLKACQNNTVWLGFNNALIQIDSTLNQEVIPLPALHSGYYSLLCPDNASGCWIQQSVDASCLFRKSEKGIEQFPLFSVTDPRKIRSATPLSGSNSLLLLVEHVPTGTTSFLQWNPESKEIRNDDLDNRLKGEPIRQFIRTRTNSLWLAGEKSLYQYITKTHTLQLIKHPNTGKSLGGIYAVCEAKDQSIWAITATKELVHIVHDTVQIIPIPPDLRNIDSRVQLLSDAYNTLWITGMESLIAVRNTIFYSFGSDVGLGAPQLFSIAGSNDKLWILQGHSGLRMLDINAVQNLQKEQVQLQPFYASNGVFLNWKAFSFNGLTSGDEFALSWRLDQGNWSDFDESKNIFIPNLRKGEHSLEYRIRGQFPSALSDKVFKENLLVPSPYYLMPQFILPVITLIISLLIAFILYMNNKRKYALRLREKDHHLEKLIELMPVIPFIINPKGIILEIFIDALELPQQLPLKTGENLLDLIPRSSMSDIIRLMRKCEERVTDETLEIEIAGRVFEFTFAPYDEDQSRVKQIAVFALDITEKKYSELEMIRARHLAENADKAKMLFLTNMSHEIRTPMNAIVGLTDIMLEENNSEPLKENLTIIKRSADNLLVIINDILDFSKIEAGKIELENIDFDLHDVIAAVFKTFQFKAEQKGLEFHKDIENGIPRYLIGDPYRLNQILVNLLGNAIKFTNKGYVKLVVKKASENPDDKRIRFQVVDTGIGISGSKIDKIFESFTQESSMITRKFGGTGLGLTISKKLVELQHGKIEVMSEIGKGSVFSFEIPFETHTNFTMYRTNTTGNRELKGVKILVVEDNQMNQVVARQILSRWEAIVHTANNGVEAIEILSAREYDVVLMDLQMPDMDGFEATRIIRNPASEVLNHQVPIIALTADAFPEVKKKAILAGMNDFVIKPFKQNELFVKIAKQVYELD